MWEEGYFGKLTVTQITDFFPLFLMVWRTEVFNTFTRNVKWKFKRSIHNFSCVASLTYSEGIFSIAMVAFSRALSNIHSISFTLTLLQHILQ